MEKQRDKQARRMQRKLNPPDPSAAGPEDGLPVDQLVMPEDESAQDLTDTNAPEKEA